MADPREDAFDVLVVGGGPAGVIAALRAGRLGARTAVVTRDALGGVAAHDGPVPVRTLAHAARLIREARALSRYGISAGDPTLDYALLLDRVREVVADVGAHSLLRKELEEANVAIREHAGEARFVNPHVIEVEHAPRLRGDKVIICTGGKSRQLDVPGTGLTNTHSGAWQVLLHPALDAGDRRRSDRRAGRLQYFNTFGSRVTLFDAAPRILLGEDEDVSAAIRAGLDASGVQVLVEAGVMDRFESCATGIRMTCEQAGAQQVIEATLAVVAIGWAANTTELDLAAAGEPPTSAAMCRWTPSCAQAHLTSSQPATSPGT